MCTDVILTVWYSIPSLLLLHRVHYACIYTIIYLLRCCFIHLLPGGHDWTTPSTLGPYSATLSLPPNNTTLLYLLPHIVLSFQSRPYTSSSPLHVLHVHSLSQPFIFHSLHVPKLSWCVPSACSRHVHLQTTLLLQCLPAPAVSPGGSSWTPEEYSPFPQLPLLTCVPHVILVFNPILQDKH